MKHKRNGARFFSGIIALILTIGIINYYPFPTFYNNTKTVIIKKKIKPQTRNKEKELPKNSLDEAKVINSSTKEQKWNTTNLKVFIATDNSIYKQAYERAIEIWNDTGIIKFTYTKNEDEANIILSNRDEGTGYTPNQEEGKVIGLTTTNTDSDNYIVKANVDFIDNTIYNNNRELKYGIESLIDVALHEIGHSIGLGHSDNMNSIMYKQASSEPLNYIDKETYDKAKALYEQ